MSAMNAMLTIDIDVAAKAWRDLLPDAEATVRAAVCAAWKAAGRDLAEAELSVVLSDDAAARALNRGYRGIDKPTNVLSFPTGEDSEDSESAGSTVLLGDVVLACETVVEEARRQHKALADHLCHLVVHGVLHLLGHDHETDADAAAMEHLEVTILADLGIADPYRETGSAAGGPAPCIEDHERRPTRIGGTSI